MILKIYYLDDDPELLSLFAETFGRADIEITTFSEPRKAIAAVHSNPPDVIFVDYQLRDTTGDEVAKGLDPAVTRALITGNIEGQYTTRFDAVFEKPYDEAEILAFLRSLQIEKVKKIAA